MKEHECKFIDIAEKVVCRDLAHLESFFQDVIDKGGEGIILRDPHAPLQSGRSSSYLKHKVFHISCLIISFLLMIQLMIQSTIRNIETLKQELLVVLLLINGNANCKLPITN